ncbi:hypothetical protein F5887DRAFT_1058825 [Amanita rubescens]|nr:hypothetical protein F5887DRAFT_1058825 [Amanita rubescens]
MAATRTQPHHPLPAPVVHSGFSVHQSKSHVLAGVQDAYWSDDETEDAECPLCLEEMDISDLNFKPCVCGYQICRFCWHHIKENLNKRCPACRRIYTDEGVEFKPINTEDETANAKELDALGRRQLANVRVVQRNVVYVVGIGPRFAKEELIPTLRSEDYFGKYGKISKILLVKRTQSGGREPVVGLYITYHRREDAARAIAAVDGAASPSGGREIMRASYGTTKYCMAFLRSVTCNDHNCMNLHEWGDEKGLFHEGRLDNSLSSRKHTIKTTESRSRGAGTTGKRSEEQDGLPRAASWAAQKGISNQPGSSATNRPGRRTGPVRQVRGGLVNTQQSGGDGRTSGPKAHDKKMAVSTATKPPSRASSRPATPASAVSAQRPATPPDVKTLRHKKDSPHLSPSPAPSTMADSDHWSSSQDVPSSAVPSVTTDIIESSVPSTPAVPPGIPLVPPGLTAPPGIPVPSRPPRVESASPRTPLLASHTSYQVSNAARALIDDIKARREAAPSLTVNPSPFPDFDRTLQTLSGGDDGGFSFNLDPKLAHEGQDYEDQLSRFEEEPNNPFHAYMDPFPLRSAVTRPPGAFAPPGLPYLQFQDHSRFDSSNAHRHPIPPIERQPSSSYMGSFNPFSDTNDDSVSSMNISVQRNVVDDDSGRKMSRFGFARGRRGSTATSSPLHTSSPISANISESHPILNSADAYQGSQAWPLSARQDYSYSHPNSAMGSPLVQLAQPHTIQSSQSPGRFRPFDDSENLLVPELEQNTSMKLPFNDPAIMSASLAGPLAENGYAAYVAPPGLALPPSLAHSSTDSTCGMYSIGCDEPSNLQSPVSRSSSHGFPISEPASSSHGEGSTIPLPLVSESNFDPPNTLSTVDFPALTANTPEEQSSAGDVPSQQDDKAREKAELKAAKKAAAAERAAERQRIAQEKAALRAAERARASQERAAEKERLAALKAERERVERERLQKEKEERALAKAESERQLLLEKSKTIAPPVLEPVKADGRKVAKNSDNQKRSDVTPHKTGRQANGSKVQQPIVETPTVAEPAPLLSKKPKKNKPVAKPLRIVKEGDQTEDATSSVPSPSEVYPMSAISVNAAASVLRAQLPERNSPTPLEEIFDELDMCYPWMDLVNHPVFDPNKVNPAAKMPLEYGPLVHALSTLSVGGGSFANNMPSGSIDNAVSSFQQLLETLTQTISDLLRLLPRTTWDDSSSFDGVLRDMLKGDDFLDDAGEEGHNKEDEVAALTLALERRARWMEVQLSKLEELHRDINLAAVRAVLSFNDNGWDRSGFLPRIGHTLRRYDGIGVVEDGGVLRPMSIDELEKKLIVAREATVFAETEVKEAMVKIQSCKPLADYYY